MTDLPDHPFTVDDLPRLGLTRKRLRTLLQQGDVRSPIRGAYVPTSLEDSLDLRVRTAALVVSPGHVVRDRTAAWLHGVDVFTYAELEEPPPVEVCALRGGQPTERRGVAGRTRDLDVGRDVIVLDGLRVTTPLRTALDLGCLLHRRDAKGALDAFARHHGVTPDELRREARRFRRRRGVVQLRQLIPLVDPRMESHRESWTQLAIHDAGLPPPEPQVWILVDGVPTYRLDFAYRRRRVAVEYDGFDAHERTPEKLEADARRRAWLRSHGWTIIVIRLGDFTGAGLDRWIRELRNALAPSYTNVRRLERGSRMVRS